MWVRFKDWELLSDNEQVKVAEIGNHQYYFWKKDAGICDVRVKKDVERLLNPGNEGFTKYEVAYEMYGILWDQDGLQGDVLVGTPSVGTPLTTSLEEAPPNASGNNADSMDGETAHSAFVPAGVHDPTKHRRKRGRPRKR